ncbi:MAG TPA: AMP-binding protein, partial [Solirubrobacterales bacterium]|nr:AMP-binding protein [Solirubrobacterales bacterium]
MAGLRDGVSVGDVIVAALRRFPDRVALRQDGVDMTYRQAEDALARWVAVLMQRGFRHGDGVGLLSPNRPEAWLVPTAAALAGGRYTALHPLGSLEDHLYACDEAELRFVFVDPAFEERAVQLQERAATVEAVFSFGASEAGEDFNRLAADVALNGRLEPGD